MKRLEAEDKLYQIEIVRVDLSRRVKVYYGTEHNEWKDDNEIETLSPPIGSIWNTLKTSN